MNTLQEQQLQDFLDSIDGDNKPQVFLDTAEKLYAVDNEITEAKVKQQLLDGIADYEERHGTKPPISLVHAALQQAKLYLDEASVGEPSATSHESNSRALTPKEAFIAIRTTIVGALPFAHNVPADIRTGEAKIRLISHKAGNNCGSYKEDALLDGLNGGGVFITTDRTHKLATTDQTTYTGKITPVMDSVDTCDQSAPIHPLYPNRTEIFVNGVLVATSQKTTSDRDVVAGVFNLHDKEISISNGSVNTKTGEVSLSFSTALEANDEVKVRGYLHVEKESENYSAPLIKTHAETRSIYATPYRARVYVTPEADAQFKDEIGIDAKFEGMMTARALLTQENLYKALNDGCDIAKFNGLSTTFDYKWAESGASRSQNEITQELLTLISTVSQKMANLNASHGVSHIYVDDKMRAIIISLDSKYFTPSGLEDKAGAYRLGRLVGKYEVYYTPKGLKAGTNMLLIGANSSNPACNPIIVGDATPPRIQTANATTDNANTGSWLLGKSFLCQNPFGDYAKSFAAITVSNTAIG